MITETHTQLDKQREIACQEFILNGEDRSKSYRKAFPQSKRWKDKTVNEKASRLFAEDKVKARVAELRLEAAKIANEQFQVDAAYVLKRLTEIDQMDVIDILDDEGNMKPVRDWPKVWRTTLSGMDINRLRTLGEGDNAVESIMQKIKWPDKVKNLELIGKHVSIGAFKDKLELSGGLTLTHEQMLDELE